MNEDKRPEPSDFASAPRSPQKRYARAEEAEMSEIANTEKPAAIPIYENDRSNYAPPSEEVITPPTPTPESPSKRDEGISGVEDIERGGVKLTMGRKVPEGEEYDTFVRLCQTFDHVEWALHNCFVVPNRSEVILVSYRLDHLEAARANEVDWHKRLKECNVNGNPIQTAVWLKVVPEYEIQANGENFPFEGKYKLPPLILNTLPNTTVDQIRQALKSKNIVPIDRIRIVAGRATDGPSKWKAYAVIGVDDQRDWDALDGAFLSIPFVGKSTYEEQIIRTAAEVKLMKSKTLLIYRVPKGRERINVERMLEAPGVPKPKYIRQWRSLTTGAATSTWQVTFVTESDAAIETLIRNFNQKAQGMRLALRKEAVVKVDGNKTQ